MRRGFDSLKLTTVPVAEPVTLADMKVFMRIDADDDPENALITSLIKSARNKVEHFLGRALITQSWTKVSDDSPSRITIEYPPLQSITSIKSLDEDGDATTNSTDNYIVKTNTEPGLVILKRGSVWITHDNNASFEIIFKAGYGDAASDVPGGIIQGIKILVNKLYHRRGDDINVLINESDVQGWLSDHRAFSV